MTIISIPGVLSPARSHDGQHCRVFSYRVHEHPVVCGPTRSRPWAYSRAHSRAELMVWTCIRQSMSYLFYFLYLPDFYITDNNFRVKYVNKKTRSIIIAKNPKHVQLRISRALNENRVLCRFFVGYRAQYGHRCALAGSRGQRLTHPGSPLNPRPFSKWLH